MSCARGCLCRVVSVGLLLPRRLCCAVSGRSVVSVRPSLSCCLCCAGRAAFAAPRRFCPLCSASLPRRLYRVAACCVAPAASVGCHSRIALVASFEPLLSCRSRWFGCLRRAVPAAFATPVMPFLSCRPGTVLLPALFAAGGRKSSGPPGKGSPEYRCGPEPVGLSCQMSMSRISKRIVPAGTTTSTVSPFL